MDAVTNPYVPGAGRKPSALVGRDATLHAWNVALQRAERGITDQPFVLYGLRGVGKTVLLTQLRHDAQQLVAGLLVGLFLLSHGGPPCVRRTRRRA